MEGNLEGTTEPVVAVIGHPVAGNPTQFALECGFAHAGVDCRVLSFDVSDDRLDVAVSGLAALHFSGVWVDASCRDAVRQWLVHQGRSAQTADVLQLDLANSPASFRVTEERDCLWPKLVQEHFLRVGRSLRRALVVGEEGERRQQVIARLTGSGTGPAPSAEALLAEDRVRATANFSASTSLREVDCVIWLADAPDSWTVLQQKLAKRDGDPVWLVDLYEGWNGRGWDAAPTRWTDPAQALVASAWLDRMTLHAALLAKAADRWFGCTIPAEVFREAIEEYLAV